MGLSAFLSVPLMMAIKKRGIYLTHSGKDEHALKIQ